MTKLGHSLSARMVVRVRLPRKVLALSSRCERGTSGSCRKSETVAGMLAWSKVSLMTEPAAIQGETRMAGTRTPRRSKAKGSSVPVSAGCAENGVSGGQEGGGT